MFMDEIGWSVGVFVGPFTESSGLTFFFVRFERAFWPGDVDI